MKKMIMFVFIFILSAFIVSGMMGSSSGSGSIMGGGYSGSSYYGGYGSMIGRGYSGSSYYGGYGSMMGRGYPGSYGYSSGMMSW